MNLLDALTRTPLAHALAAALIHSLWQGAVVALILFTLFVFVRSAGARYVAACVGLLVLFAAFTGTFVYLYNEQPLMQMSIGALQMPPAPEAGPYDPSAIASRLSSDDLLPWLAPIWLLGVLLFDLRAVVSWVGVQRLRARGACYAPAPWQESLSDLSRRMGVSRPVVLLESCLAEVPLVIGHLRPVVLLPLGLLSGLSVAQVEAIVLHELAHVRRFDYLANVLQTLLESLLFYHPAVWWMSGVARTERENCCDDLVVKVSGNAREYAAALATLEQNRHAGTELALAANGGSLVKRINRLLYPRQRRRMLLSPFVIASAAAIAAACLSFAWQAPPPPIPATPAAPALHVSPPPPPVRLAQAAPVPAPPVSALEQPWRKWLQEDVTYIITDSERKAFRSLQTDDEREHFTEQFWQRRDPTPGTPANEMKEEHYRRLAYVDNHFSAAGMPGWKTDRARIYISWGSADEVESHPLGDLHTAPFEKWVYRHIDGIGDNVIIEFVDTKGTGEYQMTRDPSEKER